ncbi:hypothetical protein [Streptosporangium sp. NPDC051022]|uniref:hypothetical protein n=1 Tax=Streptosporangium sp. NPDC051022 TaxID=3155752 RepID=UPI003428B57E
MRIDAKPGDYVFVPPYVPHREENPDPESEAVVVIARSTREAVVVNLDELRWGRGGAFVALARVRNRTHAPPPGILTASRARITFF